MDLSRNPISYQRSVRLISPKQSMWSRQTSGTSNLTLPYTPSSQSQRGRSTILAVGRNIRDRIDARNRVQKVQRAMTNAAYRMKKSRSRTLTATGQKTGSQLSAGGGETKSSFYLSRPTIKMTPLEKNLSVNTVVRNGSGTVSCVSGSQNVQAFATLWDMTDIENAIITTLGQSATGQNSSKIAMLSGTADVMFTNSNTSCNAHCIIYDCMPRQDGSDINTSPVLLFQAGGADAVGGATSDYLIPGATPYANPRFASAYKILQSTPIIVHAGATHVHRIRYKPNRIISKERTVTSDRAGPIGNVTLYTFIVFYGTPVHSAAAETTVSTGIVKLDYVFTESLKFKCMQYNYSLNSFVNSLTAIGDPEQFVEEPAVDTANTV